MQFISVQICKTGCIKSEAISSWGYLFSALNVVVGGGGEPEDWRTHTSRLVGNVVAPWWIGGCKIWNICRVGGLQHHPNFRRLALISSATPKYDSFSLPKYLVSPLSCLFFTLLYHLVGQCNIYLYPGNTVGWGLSSPGSLSQEKKHGFKTDWLEFSHSLFISVITKRR